MPANSRWDLIRAFKGYEAQEWRCLSCDSNVERRTDYRMVKNPLLRNFRTFINCRCCNVMTNRLFEIWFTLFLILSGITLSAQHKIRVSCSVWLHALFQSHDLTNSKEGSVFNGLKFLTWKIGSMCTTYGVRVCTPASS